MKKSSIKLVGILILVAISAWLSSCKSDKPEIKNESTTIITANSIYITNEGNFQFGNASISYYNPTDNAVVEDIFKANNQRNLGDVCQSMTYFNGNYYIILNNSHTIEIVNANTFQSSGVITGFNSPRYLLPINNSKAYVTDLYHNSIYIVNLSNNEISGNINCNGWSEAITLNTGNVFVTNIYRNKIYVINPQSDQITDSIATAYGGNSIIEDKNGKLWTLCNGNNTEAGGLFQLNPNTKSVEKSFYFLQGENPSRLKTNRTNDTLYWINQAIFRMPINSSTMPSTPFIPSLGKNFYGLGIDPNTNEIYISDAVDYVQKGVVYRYASNGVLVNSFRAGIIPGDFYFK